MFTQYTYEDWLAEPKDKRDLIGRIVNAYKCSEDFKRSLTARNYFEGNNEAIRDKYILQMAVKHVTDPETGAVSTVKDKIRVQGARISSSFLFRFITQENQHLLGNGVTLEDEKIKALLGPGFDTLLSGIGEKALVNGVCWGFYNNDHVEMIQAAADQLSGGVALVSERDSQPRVFVQFWQLDANRPLYVRVFEETGVSLYKTDEKNELQLFEGPTPYKRSVLRDAGGETLLDTANYPFLPVVPLFANPEHRSELTTALKSKIDCFDRIASDFSDNLEMANDVFWVLNNFGGNEKQVLETLAQIKELRAVVNISDGMGGGSTAEPHAFEVPYAARQVALDILRREMYRDAMALDIETLSGSSLSIEAIETATKELNLKCDRYEWQVFEFVQKLLRLAGVETESISFQRQNITNTTQTIQNIYLAAEDLDQETRLKLNPMIPNDDIPAIMQATAAERTTGMVSVEQLQNEINRMTQEENDGAGQGGPAE